ncbi:MAG: hypothetical protein K6B69_14075 [Lachnospiraceae bacterium]|nr:hypothetical protein [Lachnospiraceae bacterium]
MAKYVNNKGKHRTVNLCSAKNLWWNIEDIDDEEMEDAHEKQWIAVHPSILLDKYFEDVSPIYLDGYSPYAGHVQHIKLYYYYTDDDTLKLRPLATYMTYPAFKSSEGEDIPGDEFEREVSLSKDEVIYFSGLLQKAIGDKHSSEMQSIMTNYHNSVDAELKAFVQDVMSGRDVLPITVGFVNERMAKDIKTLTGLNTLGNRIVICADDIRHIVNRHGASGKADHSMQDVDDIARLCYVLANYDSIEWDGGLSKLYRTKDGKKAPQITVKKRINGTFYIIEVASDSSKKRNVVSTIYLKKTGD